MNKFMTALLLLTSTPIMANQQIGWIERISGNAEQVEIRRNGERLKAVQFTPIQTGDSIVVRAPSTSVEITLAGKRGVTVVNQSRPYTATAGSQQADEVPTRLKNLLAWAASVVAKDDMTPKRVFASTRGFNPTPNIDTPISLGLLYDGAALVAGKRPLALAWDGGYGPYEVKISNLDTRKIVGNYTTSATHLVIEEAMIEPGVHAISVTDKKNRTAEAQVLAVDGSLPATPAEISASPAHLQKLLNGAWLAAVDGGKWRLEAYSLVKLDPEASQLRETLLDELKTGRAPALE